MFGFRTHFAGRLPIAITAVVGLTCVLSGSLVVYAVDCSGFGQDFCYYSKPIPCPSGVCVAWATAFPGASIPYCDTMDPDESFWTSVAAVSIVPNYFAWYECKTDPLGEWYCEESAVNCADYLTYGTADCTASCPVPFAKQYCYASIGTPNHICE